MTANHSIDSDDWTGIPGRGLTRVLTGAPVGLSWLGICRSHPGCRLHATGRAV